MALLAAQSSAGALTQMVVTPTTFVFIGERLWLDFVNTDDLRRGVRVDVLRRWCDMATCGNRAKAARFRARERDVTPAPTSDISVRPAEARSA